MISFAYPIFAEGDKDNYTATVAVAGQSERQRSIAFTEAAHEVADNLNADSSVEQQQDLSLLFAHPEQYVASFSYIADPEQQDALEIKVRFDRDALQPFFASKNMQKAQRLDLQVSGINSAQSLNALTQYLNQINSVKSLLVSQVNGETVRLKLELQGNQAVFIQKLLTDQRLVSLDAQDSNELSALNFKWIA